MTFILYSYQFLECIPNIACDRRCPTLSFLQVTNRVHFQNLRHTKFILTLQISYQGKPHQCMVIPPWTHRSVTYKKGGNAPEID